MGAVADFFKALAGVCQTRPLSPEAWRLEPGSVRIDLDRAGELNQAGGAARLEGRGLARRLLVVRAGVGFLAFENRCAHFGRRLDPVPGQETLRCCSLNHSTYDYQGRRLAGPARGDLKTLPVEQAGQELIVSLA